MDSTSRLPFRLATLACAAILSPWAQAQAPSRVAGTLTGLFDGRDPLQVTFTCDAAGAGCAGNYRATFGEAKCVNNMYVLNAVVLSGLDLSRPGAIQGRATLSDFYIEDKAAADGSCRLDPADYPPFDEPFSGTWNGSQASITFAPIVDRKGRVLQVSGILRPDTAPAPALAASVDGRIDVAASVAAAIRARPEDVGKSASVYVLALAPASLVKGAVASKDAPAACVLAQLNASGQLQAVSASNLQAYVSGVLTAQGQAVNVINGAATANVAGATFYVGYGASAAAMLGAGLTRNVVAVPGPVNCQPQAPQAGWWWNPAEPGRGYSLEARGGNLFFAAYLYEESGRATWFAATGPTALDGSLFSGRLLAFAGGQTLEGPYHSPAPATDGGAITLAFSDASHGTLAWPGGTLPLQRFDIVAGGAGSAPQANQPESGWWWNPAEGGRGYFIEWQAGSAFVAGYMYDAAGSPTWYASIAATPDARNFSSAWMQFGNGQSLSGPYKPAAVVNGSVAPIAITFQGPDSGIITLPGGKQGAIVRFRF